MAAGTGLIVYGAFARSEQEAAGHNSHSSQPITGVVTIGKPRDVLYRSWRDPATMSQVFGDVVQVSREGEDRFRMRISLPGQHEITWTSRLIKQVEGTSFQWRSEPGATVPHEMSLRFRDAIPAEFGTVVTLSVSPLPDSTLTSAFVRFTRSLDRALLMKLLRRFKSLVETGEIPTLSRNPAAWPRAIAAV
ncbi:SRPBCC family protein [Terriglobus aquaticus]|uniref:SRPBCC family protein n=1 Tax=Terriglobus aquaticus TaxID=940139 RepID=A0ABW9KGH3_9BACT|nr:SRPBCC family protein [Terriglobus aquaticus]